MVAFVSAVVVGSLVYSAVQGKKAAKEQKRANAKQARIDAVSSQRSRAQALRQNRINASDIFAGATNAGVQGSSAVQGALGSQSTNTAVGLNFATTLEALNQQRLAALSRADGYNANAALGQAVGGIFGGVGSAYNKVTGSNAIKFTGG